MSALDATRAGALVPTFGLLRLGLACDKNSGPPAGGWPRAFEGRAWAGDCDFESHHAARGYWLDSGGSAGALPAPAGDGDGRRNSGAHAKAAERMVFRKTVGV